MTKDFYAAFEANFRGSEDEIKERLRFYFPLLRAIKNSFTNPKAIDLGCGRGEWLELLREVGIDGYGIDLDEGMLSYCTKKSLTIQNKDALTALKELQDDSISLVTGFHIIEHLPFELQFDLIKEAHRVLCGGGILILETPNPENIYVATNSFYIDPTHKRPLPSGLLKFLADFNGFYRSIVVRLQEKEELLNKGEAKPTIIDVLTGASPDYAVVAQKRADERLLFAFRHFFNGSYGISTDMLATNFDSRLDNIEDTTTTLKAQILILQEENKKLMRVYNRVENTISKIKYPFKLIAKILKIPFKFIFLAIDKTVSGQTRVILKRILLSIKEFIRSSPLLLALTKKALSPFPILFTRLKNISVDSNPDPKRSKTTKETAPIHLSPRAREIYEALTHLAKDAKSLNNGKKQ